MKAISLSRQICEDWMGKFPELGKYHKNKFYKIVGPLIVGIELIDVPMMEQYRPFFSMYSMWESNVKACFNHPLIYFEFSDEKKTI